MDIKLLISLKKGDRNAFETLIRLYYPRLMGYTCIMVDEEAARDIVQDVFMYLWENRERFDFTPGLHSYLFRMCHSRVVDYLRRNKIFAGDAAGAGILLDDKLSWLNGSTHDIVKMLSDKDLLRRVDELIEELPERRREVFKLSFFHELSNAEISSLLGMPRRTVESHLYLSLKFLRGKISPGEIMAFLFLLADAL